MKRRQFFGSITGVMLAGLFKWNFPVLGKPIEDLLILDEAKPAANTVYWGGGTGEWSDPKNWVGGFVPNETSHVVITGGEITLPSEQTHQTKIDTLTIIDGTVGLSLTEGERIKNQLDKAEVSFSSIHLVNAEVLDVIEKRGVEEARKLTWDSR